MDIVPYQGISYKRTHIAHLYAAARLIGREPVDFRRARVLELGCDQANNLVPMADQYPESDFVGIDIEASQVARGEALARELGLRNLTLRAESILDFPASAGKFDYILCHGIVSWVPAEVREGTLEVIRRHLSPEGIAVVSYNTLPGWGAVRSLRDAMLYHTRAFAAPAEKAAQARGLLQFLHDAQGDEAQGYRALLTAELAIVDGLGDNHLLHDHLGPHNHAFYLHEFVAMAKSRGLGYLGDADLGIPYLGNYSPRVREVLAAAKDLVRLEQYLDFVKNRRFRSSLLALGERPLAAQFDLDFVRTCWLKGPIRPEGAAPREGLRFTGLNDTEFAASDGDGAALFLTLAARGAAPAAVTALAAEAKARYRLPAPAEALERKLAEAALHVFLSRGLDLLADPGRAVFVPSERPLALPVARAEAKRGREVTNAFHESVALDPPTHALLPLLDGSRDRAALAAAAGLDAARIESALSLLAEHGLVVG